MNTALDYPACDDGRLVELHLAGDRAAFRQIVERYQAMVCALGLSACGDVGCSEDLAQEVFVAAWKQLPELREPAKLRGWLAGIARNRISNSFRRQQRTPTARAEPLSTEAPASGDSPREHAINMDEAALMWSALAGISENYREPMVLFYREQRSVSAVAAALEISKDLVRQRLVRGRAMLTERMAKFVEESLERSAPTPAFAGAVLLSLPVVGTAVAETTLGAGGAAAKALAAAGAVGTAAAKGGLAVKTVSMLALLPAVVNGIEEFIRFRVSHQALSTGGERRRVAWAYVIMHASLGIALIGFFLLPRWTHVPSEVTTLIILGLLGLLAVGLLFVHRWASRRLGRSVPMDQWGRFAEGPEASASVFECRSAEMLLGLSLFHVRLGGKRTWRQPVVKAWIAISDGRAMGGLFAFGQATLAPISMGVVSAGLFSVGGLAVGGWVIGGVAGGWLSEGFVAAGWRAAKGGAVWAQQFAAGSPAFALHANDPLTAVFFRDNWFFQAAVVVVNVVSMAVFLAWVMPVVLMGWHLWRTRAMR